MSRHHAIGFLIPHLQQQPLTRLISDNEHLSWTCHRWLQGRRWGLHVVEAPWAWLLAATYIAATVISRHPPFIAIGKVSSVHTLPVLFELCCHVLNAAHDLAKYCRYTKRFSLGLHHWQTTSVSIISNPCWLSTVPAEQVCCWSSQQVPT